METETVANSGFVQEVKRKRKKSKFKKSAPKKFNKEGFLISWGLAILFTILGFNTIFKIKNPPASPTDSTLSFSTNHLIGFTPHNAKEFFIFLLGSILLISAAFCIFLGLKYLAQFIAGKNIRFGKSKFFKNRFQKLI
jgi:hypothetical protein